MRGLGWHAYRDGAWVEAGEELVVEAVRRYLKQLLLDAVEGGEDAARLQALSRLQSHSKIRAVTALTRGIEGVAGEVQDFDSDPWLLNVGNGVVDLTTRTLMEHSPAFLLRKKTAVNYVPGARHRDWDTALGALPDAATARWMQIYLGSGATGLPPREDLVTFWHGGGSNGKSTLLGAVQTALGSYSRMLLPTTLGGRREEHPTEFMDLMGTRLAVVEETADGHRLDVVKLKKFTGTEMITGRRMREDPVSFKPSHTLVVTTNYRPVVSDTDHGTWRRLRMIPFPHTFGAGGRRGDRNLRSRLINGTKQQEAVLAWLVDGARQWHDRSLGLPAEPAAVKRATQEWRESTDLIYTFARDCLRAAPGERVEVEALRNVFNEWLPKPHQPWGRQVFAERLEQHEALQKLGAVRGLHPRTRRACFSGIQPVAHWTGTDPPQPWMA